MKNSIGFLGVGQAGSNIALGFERLGYNVAYLNTSKEDLNSLKYAKHKIHVRGGEGASKNRKAVLQLASESIDEIINDVLSVLTQEYIMIIFSAGGGTGSGLGPVLASYLSRIGRKVMCVTILPCEKESPKTCENAYNTCVDISNIEGLGSVFLLDNNNHEDKFALNDIFVKDIDSLLNLNNCSKFGNIDKSEIKTLLSTQGLSVITRQSKAKSTAPFIIQGFMENIYADIEEKAPVVVGVSTTNKSLNFDDIYCEIGYPYDDFRGISNTSTLCMASGYPWPLKRLEVLKDKASRVSINRTTLGLSKIGEQVLSPVTKTISTSTINTRDLILNFLNN
jgi:cell division GTPase FtsZ